MSETIEAPPDASAGRAKKSSFYLAMRILPKPQRQAMYEVYSFCRLVDDIADLATAIHDFGLPRKDFHAIIDGMDMDVAQDIRAPDWATLELYCDRVASAVGRLSVCIFGTPQAEREGLAHHLGKALQLTNILRDIDEDAAIGRLYLPREALEAAGIFSREPGEVAADPRLPQVCGPVVERAQAHFLAAEAIMARCPRKTVKAPRIMDEAYGEILAKLVSRGFVAPRERVSVSKGRFLLSLLRHMVY